MPKRAFITPFVMSSTPSGDEVVGGGTGQSGDPFACYYDDWQTLFASDLNNDGNMDKTDYCLWWLSKGYTWEDWLDCGNTESDWLLSEYPNGHN